MYYKNTKVFEFFILFCKFRVSLQICLRLPYSHFQRYLKAILSAILCLKEKMAE